MQMPESIGAVGGESVSTALTRLQSTHHRPSGTEAKWARLDLLYIGSKRRQKCMPQVADLSGQASYAVVACTARWVMV